MKESFKRMIWKSAADVIHRTTVKNVNKACYVFHGQMREPSSLHRFKQTNTKNN